MANRWRGAIFGVLAVLVVSGPARGDDDPFRKSLQGRLSHALNARALEAETGTRMPGVRATGTMAGGAQRVVAVIELEQGADGALVAMQVEAAGGRVLTTVDHLMKVELPATRLRAVSGTAGIARMRLPIRPHLKDAVVSEGVTTTHAREYSGRTGATGAGVTVAVLDAGFARAEELVGSELPETTAGTDFVLERLGTFEGEHGTACAEIVHDMAPEAQLVLAGFEDDVSWAAAVDFLVGSGIKIISHSIGFDNVFPPDGNNYYAQKVDQASAAGVLFVTAAGNEAGKYWSGSWRDTNGNGFLEFGGTEMLPIAAAAPGSGVVLRWDDPFGASTHDYDMLVVTGDFASNPVLSRDNPAIVAASVDLQNGTGNPREIAEFELSEDQQLYVVVFRDPSSPASASQRFWIWAADGIGAGYAVPAGSLTLPGDARGALTVGAVGWSSGAVEPFSSRGPTMDGRVKPDIAGPDAVTTVSYGGEPFYGTSAATPHVAGAAALMLSRNPSMTGSQLRTALEQATASGGRTRNNDVGTGVLDLNLAR